VKALEKVAEIKKKEKTIIRMIFLKKSKILMMQAEMMILRKTSNLP